MAVFTVAVVAWSLCLGTTQVREAEAQGVADGVSAEFIWTDYIPGLAGNNTVRRERNRRFLVQLGEDAVGHLATALATPSLLRRLHEVDGLPGLRNELVSDMQAWLDRNAQDIVELPRIRRLVNTYSRYIDNDRLLQGAQYIFEALDRHDETVPRPELLNSVRAFAALALGEIGATQHAADVAELLHDGSRDVRARAIQALGRLGASEYSEEVEPFLFARDDVFTRSCAWTALRRMESRDTVTRLIQELATIDPATEERRQRLVVQALEGITMRNFGTNAGLWHQWWARAQNDDDPFGQRFAQAGE